MADFGKDLLAAGKLGMDEFNRGQLDRLKASLTRARGVQKDGEGAQRTENPEEVKKAATQFEALLVHQMMKSMWKTVHSEGLLTGSREEELYRDMLNEAIAGDISKGQGIGIKEIIMRELGVTKQEE